MSLYSTLSSILGGIGLFLLGMALMTDGLKALAGASLRDHLIRLTRRPRDAVLGGAAITALVQSSSATTLATIGFVSAGLLPFHTAIGVVVGANIGTTSTGWLVAVFGLKFSIAKLAMPLVGAGALLRIVGRDRLAHAGSSAAGFGMIFIGIEFLQQGMAGLSAFVDPASYAVGGFGGRLLLVGIGMLMTVIMQSSSAAVATTLTALSGGALNLEQAAALVIGQNFGTTVTAVIGSIGATIPAQRTAAIHVLFNLLTGIVAVAILPLFTGLVARLVDLFAPNDPALTIAAFHTAFNLLGAALFLPLSRRMAHLVQRLLRERDIGITRHLHRSVSGVPALATKAGHQALCECMGRLIWQLSGRLGAQPAGSPQNLEEVRLALPRINLFLASMPAQASSAATRRRQIDLMRSVDHLTEVTELLAQDTDPSQVRHEGLAALVEHSRKVLESVRRSLRETGHARPGQLRRLKRSIAKSRYQQQALLDAHTPDLPLLTQLLQMQHWIEQLVYHLWRALRHLEAAAEDAVRPDSAKPADKEPAGAAESPPKAA